MTSHAYEKIPKIYITENYNPFLVYDNISLKLMLYLFKWIFKKNNFNEGKSKITDFKLKKK